MEKSPDSKKPATNAYAKYTGIAFNMAVAIGLGVWLGSKADRKYGTETPYFAALGAVLGLAVSFLQLYRMLTDDERRKKKSE